MQELNVSESFLYTHFDKDLAKKYCKNSCKWCRGKGWTEWDHPQKLIPPRVCYCQCVAKNVLQIIDFCNEHLPHQKVEESESERVLEVQL